MVKRPEVKVILVAYHYGYRYDHRTEAPTTDTEPCKAQHCHIATRFRIIARDDKAILELHQVAREGDALWERGMLEDLEEKNLAYQKSMSALPPALRIAS